MRRYRELLDAEDNAFDELEHAYEDGDREHFETDYAAWQSVLGRKIAFLERRGIAVESTLRLPLGLAGRFQAHHYDGGVSTAYTATPITAAPEHLARVKYDADGLVPAIVQEAGTGAVLMLAYMNDDALRADAGDRPHLVLVPQPAGVLVQGGDVGRPAVRAGGLLRLRRRHAAVRRRPGREGRLPHRRADVLLPQLRRPGRLTRRMAEPLHPSPTEFAELAAGLHGGARVAGGAGRPRDAGVGVPQAGRRRARGSCSSRSSTASGGAGTPSSGGTRPSR